MFYRFRSSVLFMTLVSAAVLQGCDNTPEMGRCYTTAGFRSSVERVEAERICQDWVHLLATNCVGINNLPENPSEEDVAQYCADAVDLKTESDSDGYAGTSYYAFSIRHECDFVANPTFGCERYASEPRPLTVMMEDSDEFAQISEQVSRSKSLSTSADVVTLHADGQSISFSAL